MNNKYHTQNTKAGGKILPPPTSYKLNPNFGVFNFNESLLHRPLARCGRVFCCLLLLLWMPLVFASCEKEQPATAPSSDLTRTIDTADSTAAAGLGLTITVDTTWAGETYINY